MLHFSWDLVISLLILLMFIKYYNYFLMILMCLEFLVLSVLFMIFLNLSIEEMEVFYLMIMIFFVIESVLGLSILVCLVHFKGNDQMKNLSLLMW
uniref:NADH dehydrogenase subunit 4L n=3 Tax=Antodynerus TaxID=2612822 RepID=A0A6M9ATH9_9HYME|nr:NADH dehydrogenase subunit 4L [Antodynerus aff. limbatus YN]QKK69229.1 NADH dehydrogenase subunit 4L [Antodynerus aff. limbatus GX]QKK69242.1 NADH dehydrogenase subunit 4L [Antodynerus aff. limbatus XZ]QKK69255.1 NADH dehydrogenase subunit 4L [Antodynerus aff. limbatus YN]